MKRLIAGLVAALFSFHVVLADGLTGTVTPQDGGGINLSFNGGIGGGGSFVPLAGSAVDMSFSTGQYYGGTLANLLSTTRAQTVSSYAQTVAGALVPFAANTPRITDQGLLIEEARTNIVLQSQFASGWSTTNVTQSVNNAVAPDGTTTADLITDNNTSGQHAVTQNLNFSQSVVYTTSCFVKAGTLRYVSIGGPSNLVGNWPALTFDTQTQAIQANAGVTSSGFQVLANGWFRVWLTSTTSSSIVGDGMSIGGSDVATAPAITAGRLNSYVGTNQTFLAWGAQIESGPSPLSYTPTTTVSVTRAADVITATGALLTIVSAAQGTVLGQTGPFPGGATVLNGGVIFASGSATLQRYPFNNTDLQTSNGVNLRVNVGGAAFAAATVKMALGWSGAGRSIAGNNVLATDATTISLPSSSIGSTGGTGNFLDTYLKRLTAYNVRQADVALQALTQ